MKRFTALFLVFLLCLSSVSVMAQETIGVELYHKSEETTLTGQEGNWPYHQINLSEAVSGKQVVYESKIQISGVEEGTGSAIAQIHAGFQAAGDTSTTAYVNLFNLGLSGAYPAGNSSDMLLAAPQQETWYQVKIELDLEQCKYRVTLMDEAGELIKQSAYTAIPANSKGVAYPGANLVGIRMMRGTSKAAHTYKMKDMRAVYLPEESAPAIEGLIVGGNPYAGKTVFASYTFTAYPSEGDSLYQWYSCDQENGAFQAVEGANEKEFTIPQSLLGSYVKVQVTPVNTNGDQGDPVVSAPVQVRQEPAEDYVGVPVYSRPAEITYTGQQGNWPYLNVDAFDEIKSNDILINTDLKIGNQDAETTADIALISLGFTDGVNKGYAHTIKVSPQQAKDHSGSVIAATALDTWYHFTIQINMENKTYFVKMYDEDNLLLGQTESKKLPGVTGVDADSASYQFMGLRLMRGTSKATHSLSLKNVMISYLPLPTAPTAEEVKITGNAVIGQQLTGTYTYVDVNADPEGETAFRWLRSGTQDGTYTPIAGAVGKTYTVTEEDREQYLKFEVTPKSIIAPTEGEAVTSDFIAGPTAPLASQVTLTGKAVVGETLTVDYTYSDRNNDPQGDTKVIWMRKTGDGEFTEITRGKTYVLTNDDIEAVLKIQVIPVSVHPPYEGTAVYSAEIKGPSYPLAKNVTISGVAGVDQLLTAEYEFEDPNGFEKTGERYQWYVSDSREGTYTPISGAAEKTYRVTQESYGKYLKVGVVPQKSEQPAEGIESFSAPFGPIGEKADASAPEAKNVSIAGMPYIGQTLTGSYTYYDINEDPQGETSLRWLISSDENGTFTPVDGAVGNTLVITGNMVGKYIKFEVTPRSTVEPVEGEAVTSEAVKIQAANSFYVAPDGSDDNDGTKERPFLTIAKARDAIRELKQASGLPAGGITVYLREGDYTLHETLTFTAEDSGTKDAPIRYRAYRDEKVVINGGVSLDGGQFTKASSDVAARLPSSGAKENVVQFDLKSIGITDFGKIYPSGHVPVEYYEDAEGPIAPELFINGSRMTLARYPNDSYTTIKRVIDPGDYVRMWSDDKKSDPNYVPEDQRTYPPRGGVFEYSDNRIENWATYEDVWMKGYWGEDWADGQVAIKSVDKTAKTISTVHASTYSYKDGKRYYYLNVLDELDVPGEWYLDRKTGVLYVYPDTSDFANADIALSLLEDDLIQATGVSYLTFKGLTVENGRASGIVINGSNNTVDGCTVTQLAYGGVSVAGNNNTIKNCEISYLGAYGAMATGGNRATLSPANNVIENCLIHDWGVLYRTYQCGIHMNGVGNQAVHNELYNAPHIAIIYGGNENVIEYNVIHDVCQETTDAAAIYSGRDWTAQGNSVSYNYLYHLTHDVQANFGPFGIYFDDALSGQRAVGNILVDVKDRGFHIGGGRDHVVENNIFVNIKYPISYDDRGRSLPSYFVACMDMETGTMWKNLKAVPYTSDIWKEKYPNLAKVLTDPNSDKDDPDWPGNPSYSSVQNNVTVNCTTPLGLVNGSVFTYSTVENNVSYKQDPGFVDAANGDYNLKPDSQIFTDLPEFQAIPFDEIGRYGVILSAAPSVFDASISGLGYVGNTIAASYRFYDPEGDEEGDSTIRWYSSSTEDGAYAPITGVAGKQLVITGDLVGKYLKYEVTPCDETGVKGEPVRSSAVFVTVDESSFGELIQYAQNTLEQAVEGSDLGQYPTGSKERLAVAIAAANDFYESGSSEGLEEASEALSSAFDQFRSSQIKSVTVPEGQKVSLPAQIDRAEIQTAGTAVTIVPAAKELPVLKVTLKDMTVDFPEGCVLNEAAELLFEGVFEETVDFEPCKTFTAGTAGVEFTPGTMVTISGAAGNKLCRIDGQGQVVILKELTEDSFEIQQGGTYYLGVFAPKSDDATLSGITINGKALSRFSPDKIEYNYILSSDSTVVIQAVPTNENATVEINMPESLPGTATIQVTAEDHKATKTYQIKMAVQSSSPSPTSNPTVAPPADSPVSNPGIHGAINGPANEADQPAEGSLFTDIIGHWAEADINEMAKQGIVSGVTATTFEPDRSITRAEFAALITRALKLTAANTDTMFTDVSSEAWYTDEVAAAAGAGLMAGYEGYFRPDELITREEMAVVMVKAYVFRGKSPLRGKLDQFTDQDEISEWAKDYADQAVSVGLISGMGANIFAPRENATRAQVASIIKRLFNQ